MTSACKITSSDGGTFKVLTARGRLSYPWLFKPNKDDKYSVTLLFPKTADLSELEKAIELAAKAEFGPDYAKKYPKFHRPILDTAKSSPACGANFDEFPKLIRPFTKAEGGDKPAPGVVDHNTDPVGPSEVYAGRWALLSIAVKGFISPDGTKKGVTCYLNNVQVLEHGERLGGGARPASEDFEAVDISDSADALFR